MPLPKGLLKSLIRQGMSAPEAMKEAWRQVRRNPGRPSVDIVTPAGGKVFYPPKPMRRVSVSVNPGAAWHSEAAASAAKLAVQTPWAPGRVFFHGKMRAHQESAVESRRLGMNPRRNEYQGWTNWETWNINLWAMNEEPAYRYIMERRPFTAESAKRIAVELFPRGTPDMQHRGLPKYEWVPKVNWREIAESWNEGYEGNPRRRKNPDIGMTFNTKAKANRYASAMRKLGHDVSVVPQQYGTFRVIIHEPKKKNPRPSAIPSHKLALANRYLNMIRNAKKRAYGFAYLNWMKGGAVGNSPDPPAGLSVMAAQAVRMELDAMGLWENRNPRGSQNIIAIKPTGDPYGRGWEGSQSTDGGQTWFYRGDIGRQSRQWWRAYARREGASLRVENPLTRQESGSVIRAARTASRQARRGGRSPQIGTESARDYFTGRRDALVDVAYGFGPQRFTRARRIAKFAARRRTGMRLGPSGMNPPRLIGPIPGVMRRIEYRRTKDRPGLYYHNFKRGVRAYALSDGSVLLRGPKPLYVNQ